MADFVQVVVQVDKSQLASLKADVDKLNGKKIHVGVDNKAVDTATQSVKKFGNAAETAAKQSKSLSGALSDYVQWYLRWTVISGAFQAGIASIGKALETMKAVDAELVTVRKVTGFAADEMKRIEEQAYKTASAYGVAADAYLKSVAAFARAGYKEQSEALAELSTKTQIVGDTTAEVANQFLLSVDAAYKYKGSIQELSKVLDGANELDNKYATSIEKIAEGMGIVAPVAAQMHVTIGELAAGIGTITAVTQRSGSEAARALRALFLNIAGDTKTEIDEGVTWTTGEIEGLREVVKLYAKDAYDAAQASKSVIDPMRAMEGLAKSMQEGILSEEKLVEMVSDIGGKLRTSQLLAIIQNWDMYSSMLNDFANAAGSADKEVSNALDSWERKTAQLSNAWAEFVSHLIETKTIKSGLDLLITAVNFLDSGFGRLTVTVGITVAAFVMLNKAAGGALISTISMLAQHFVGLQSAELLAAGASGVLGTALNMIPLFAVITAVTAAILVFNKFNVTAKEHAEAMRDANREYDEATRKADELKTKLETNVGLLRDANKEGKDESYINRLEKENEKLKEQIEYELQRAAIAKKTAAEEAVGALTKKSLVWGDNALFPEPADIVEQAGRSLWYYSSLSTDEKKKLEEQVDTITAARDAILAYQEAANGFLPESMQKTLSVAEAFLKRYADLIGEIAPDVSKDLASMLGDQSGTKKQMEALAGLIGTLDGLSGKLSVAEKAFKDFNEDGKLSYSTISSLITNFKDLGDNALNGYIERLTDANLTGDELKRVMGEMTVALVDQKIAAGELTEQNKALVVMMLSEAGVANADEVATSLFARAAKRAADAASDATGAVRDFNGVGINTSGKVQAIRNVSVAFEGVRRSAIRAADAIAAFNGTKWTKKTSQSQGVRVGTFLPKTTTPEYDDIPDDYGGGGGGGSSSSSSDPKLDAYKNDVELLKSQLDLLEKSGAAEDKRIAKMREIQAALHAQAEYMRSIGADQKEINALSSSWWDYSKKILDIQKEIADNLKKELDTAVSEELDKAKSARDEEIEAIDKQIEQLNKQNEAADKQNKLQQLKADIIEKQNALLAAQAERNIRVYNKATGQWEWTANTANIRSAEDALASARKSLSDYEAEQSQNAEIEALNARKAAVNAEYDALEAEWKSITKSLQEPTRGIAEILKDVEANGAARLKEQIEKINGLLGNLASYIGSAGGYDAGDGLSVSGDVQSFYGGLDKAGIATASNNGLTTSMAAKAAETYNSMHNGDVYEMNGVEISEQKARATTVYEMAQMARNLVLHNGVKSYA